MNLNVFTMNFLMVLLLTALLGMSCPSIFMCWLFMEISMLSMLMIMEKKSSYLGYSLLQYFVIQSSGSALLIFSTCFSMYFYMSSVNILFILSLLLKLGSMPFYQWYMDILMYCNWESFFLISTVQKILPLFILSSTSQNLLIFISMVLNIMLSSFLSLGEGSIKKLLGFSSIFNMSWFMALVHNLSIMIFYLIVYSVALFALTILMKMHSGTSSFHVNKIFMPSSSKKSFFLAILSMGGFPPLIGFYAKLSASFFIMKNSIILMILLLSFSFFMMFIYMNMTYIILSNQKSVSTNLSKTNILWLDFIIISSTIIFIY